MDLEQNWRIAKKESQVQILNQLNSGNSPNSESNSFISSSSYQKPNSRLQSFDLTSSYVSGMICISPIKNNTNSVLNRKQSISPFNQSLENSSLSQYSSNSDNNNIQIHSDTVIESITTIRKETENPILKNQTFLQQIDEIDQDTFLQDIQNQLMEMF